MPGTIMIIDDDQDILGMMRYALESYGYEVLTCTTPAEALRHAASTRCSVIVTDHDMQGMSGLELTRRLRAMLPSTIIIGMSGKDLNVPFLEAGANDFVQKPFVPYDLVMMIDGMDLPS